MKRCERKIIKSGVDLIKMVSENNKQIVAI